jgi:hypothetical protein
MAEWEGPPYEYGVTWGARSLLDRFRDWWTSPNRRPLWQMPLIAVALIFYWPASAFVNWMDGK